MKRTVLLLLTFIMIISSTAFSVFGVNAASNENLLGEKNRNPGFTMDISVPDSYKAGEKVVVTVTINNVNAPAGLQHVHGKMFFDTEVLGFNVPLKDKQELRYSFDGFNEWEDLTRLKTDEKGLWWIEIDAATAGDAKGNISDQITDGQLVFHITFVALADAAGDTVVYIPHSTVIGDHYAMTPPFAHTPYKGNGSLGVIPQQKVHSGESSDDENNSSQPPIESVNTGDLNGNGKIDGLDCLALKRAYFKRYTISDVAVGDMNKNGNIDKNDCLLLIRTYIESYN